MEKTQILEVEFQKFDLFNRNRSRFYYTDIEWNDLQKHIIRIKSIKKIWKKDTH
jgi:hypothetical protein